MTFQDKNMLAPPWMALPYVERGSIHWRMGIGEAYMEKWGPWYRSLQPEEKETYLQLFPEPLSWRGCITGLSRCETRHQGDLLLELWREDGIPNYSREQICANMEAGAEPEFLFFWGHRPAKDGKITKSCFSQWWMSDFWFQGLRYCCMEQCMMAGKASLFKDTEAFDLIRASTDPKEIKALGRGVRSFNEKLWNEVKYPLVLTGNYNKFVQNDDLRNFLLSTGNRILVEASPYDKIWGIGLSADDPRAKDPRAWNGENLLGFALMEVRDEIRRVYANEKLCSNPLQE